MIVLNFKSKLVRYNEKLHFVSASGETKTITMAEAREYFANFETLDPTPTTIEALVDALENYKGDLLLLINTNGVLEVHDPVFFRDLMNPDVFPYYTTQEFADKESKARSLIIRLCKAGRIQGAVQIGQTWYIPKTSPYPHDNRLKSTNED